MSICFLLGSGASVPAGFPTVAEITNQLATPCETLPEWEREKKALHEGGRKLLRWLEVQIKRRYGPDAPRTVHYENLYFLAKQLLDDLDGEYENPALRPFVESAFEQVLPHIPTIGDTASEELRRLAEWVTVFIRSAVVERIGKHKATRFDHLDFMLDGIKKSGVPNPTILTVNHDTLVEKILTQNQMEFADGFGKEANIVGVRQWETKQLLQMSKGVRLLKLHGGINWRRFRPLGVQTHLEDYFGIRTAHHSATAQDASDRPHHALDDLPLFLIGTWDKLARYTDSLYLELYFAAFEALASANTLVVVGYGFGDKGINKLVADWMCRSTEHRLVLIDLNADQLWQHMPASIWSNWQTLIDERRLFPVVANLKEETISWSLIEDKLTTSSAGT